MTDEAIEMLIARGDSGAVGRHLAETVEARHQAYADRLMRDPELQASLRAMCGASNLAGRTGYPIQGSVNPNDVVFGSVDQSGRLYRWSDGTDGERPFMPVAADIPIFTVEA